MAIYMFISSIIKENYNKINIKIKYAGERQ